MPDTTLDTILEAFRDERFYQIRRWGLRQPDGTFHEFERSLTDWLVYMDHWSRVAQHNMTRQPADIPALDALRKVACLVWAALEQDNYTLDGIVAALNIRQENTPFCTRPLSEYLLAIRVVLDDAIRAATQWDRQGEAKALILDLLHLSIGCFLQYGIPMRDLSEPIINARDGEPA